VAWTSIAHVRRRSTAGRTGRSVPASARQSEYLVAYRDRDAVPHGVALNATGPGGPLPFQNPLVIDGQVAGTWKPVRPVDAAQGGVVVQVSARTLKRAERRGLAEAAARYGRFLDAAVTVRFT
jgi:DNA glycosylase AlkZ-like